MRRICSVGVMLLSACVAMPVFAAKKAQGTATLKDVQPTGQTDKNHKHQAFDLTFDSESKRYTCRTTSSKSMNATDFVVGTPMNYEVDGSKAKLKTQEGKQVGCTIVRVEAIGATAPTPPAPPAQP